MKTHLQLECFHLCWISNLEGSAQQARATKGAWQLIFTGPRSQSASLNSGLSSLRRRRLSLLSKSGWLVNEWFHPTVEGDLGRLKNMDMRQEPN